VASFGFAIVPIGMLCSQYLFFLSRPRAAVAGAVAGACTGAVVTALLVQGGNLTLAAWGLPAGTSVYALITGLASFRVLSAGEESFYGSF
jgi:EamA domain-containing membrane protein RarD